MKNELLLEAVNLSIEVWEYLYTHSEIKSKNDLPEGLFDKIKNLAYKCPLCDYFLDCGILCTDCPLKYCLNDNSNYKKWYFSNSKKLRAKHAGRIMDILCQWKKDNGYD